MSASGSGHVIGPPSSCSSTNRDTRLSPPTQKNGKPDWPSECSYSIASLYAEFRPIRKIFPAPGSVKKSGTTAGAVLTAPPWFQQSTCVPCTRTGRAHAPLLTRSAPVPTARFSSHLTTGRARRHAVKSPPGTSGRDAVDPGEERATEELGGGGERPSARATSATVGAIMGAKLVGTSWDGMSPSGQMSRKGPARSARANTNWYAL